MDRLRCYTTRNLRIPAAREEFGLGDGVWFDNHANSLEVERSGSDTPLSRPDQFCIHRVDSQSKALLTTVEYKPPHKLSVQTIHEGFRPMEFWQEIVKPDIILKDGPEKQRYNTAHLAGSVAVQQFHGMIQYRVGCSSITNGLLDAWRNAAEKKLLKWHTSFNSERSQIPAAELPPVTNVGYASSEYTRNQGGQSRPYFAQYCGLLDPNCLNTELHILGGRSDDCYLISAEDLAKKLKAQLNRDLDYNCTLTGPCGSYGAPFKIICAIYGYIIVGKGTTSRLWNKVLREVDIYRVLQRAQGSAVPVFLGAIDLAQIYFLHGAGEICHILLMGWGGESVDQTNLDKTAQHIISQSVKEIRSLGILHRDL
ncbi:hypothetical protein P170DRAFT_455646 [Aspergillus steynii IBT 23096]|uniref:Protein kinase domain-containing protein n=1 Tax=Aspergillus steynii IBT 23096 TaxID=1392250 RepID=A0A2I2G7D1_9EURO|nr:uncharacterized protein P170DRAFT_455646 [Aspergillus steynii IBT 23096]PLB48775.1 hypothetical protein P170DRAFT_455646 [Aspergillus steynii IBT 23096]